jgi:hypothetical protein
LFKVKDGEHIGAGGGKRGARRVGAPAAERLRLTGTAPIAWALIAWCVACLLVGFVVLVLSLSVPVPETFWGVRGQQGIISGATVFVGGLLALKRPENPVSWLILAAGATGSLSFVGGEYAIAALAVPAPGAAVAAWLGGVGWIPMSGLLFEMGLLFPSGTPLSPRWRYAVLVVAVGSAASFSFFAFYPGPLQQLPYDNPFGLAAPRDAFDAASTSVVRLFALGAIIAFISLVLRYRTSAGEVRQQLKWLVVAGSFAAITQFLAVASRGVPPLVLLAALGIVAFLVSIGLAILKYGLYEIDLVIRRTLVYGVTTAGIAAAFFGGIVVLQALLRPFTAGSEIAVAASTLLTVALFQPFRSRVQQTVDRSFDRARYDAAQTLDAFAEELRDEVDLAAVRAHLLDAVAVTMAPAHMSLWLLEPARPGSRT